MSKTLSLITALALLSTSACIINGAGTDDDSDTSDSGDGDGDGDVNPGCAPACEAIVGADCENGPTMEGCLLTCKVLTSADACDEKAQTYFDCVDENGVTCNGAGDPVAETCGLAWLDAIGCAVTESPNPDVVEPCADYCGNIADTACPNNGTEQDCNTGCLWSGAKGTGCADEWMTYLDCANAANWSCLFGWAIAEGCGPDYTAYTTCINEAQGG